MAMAIVLSGIVALTLTPVLCAIILKPLDPSKRSLNPLTLFLRFVDRGIVKIDWWLRWIIRGLVTQRLFTMLVVVGFGIGILMINRVLPSGFIPLEDQGIIYGIIQTPPGSTLEYTNSKSHELQKICKELDDVVSVSSLAGYEVLTEGRGSNAGTCIINLKPWATASAPRNRSSNSWKNAGARSLTLNWSFTNRPRCRDSGLLVVFSLNLLDKTNSGDYERLGKVKDTFMEALSKRPELKGLFTFFANNYPQYELVINNDVAMQKGVSIADAMNNLSIVIGSTWEQGFVRFGQFYKVYVQAAPEFRRYPSDFDNLFVKNDHGDMVPYSAFMTLKKQQGLNEIGRYNLYPTAAIQGAPAPGYSTGQAIQAIREVAKQTLPKGYDIGWQGLSYDEANKGNTATYIFLIVVLFVYLVLVGQYESFLLPLAVIVSLPIGLFGSFAFLNAMGLANDVYCQIGLVMLVVCWARTPF